jgi:hypothetical protein
MSGMAPSKIKLIHFMCNEIRDENEYLLHFEGGEEILMERDVYVKVREYIHHYLPPRSQG